MDEKSALAALSALSGETRMRMFRQLVIAGDDGLTAGNLATVTEAAPSRASFHLNALSKAGLITSTKAARQVTYQVDFTRVAELFGFLLKDCCQNNPIVMSSCCGLPIKRSDV